jgi:hypothetical protein
MKQYKRLPKKEILELKEKIKELTFQNLSDREIGNIVGKNYRTISHHRKNMGLEPSMPETNYENERDRIKGYMVRNSKFMAKRRNIEFNLKYTDFDLPEFCPFLNIKLTFKGQTSGQDMTHASLDRINNSKGYIPGNVLVISRLANQMKNCATFDQLLTFCDNIKTFIIKTQGARGNVTDCSSLDS